MHIPCLAGKENKVKRTVILTLIIMFVLNAGATVIGKIKFINGEAWYRDNQNKAYVKTTLGSPVDSEGFIKTGLDSEVDIAWNNNMVSTIGANREANIGKLWEEEKAKPTFKNRLLENLHNLRLQSNRRATSEAGIRREEAVVEQDNSLFWSSEDTITLDDAIAMYDAGDTKKAIPAFMKVIEQGPLAKEAEMAHGYLILIYDEAGDKTKALQELSTLKEDFPASTILDKLPSE